MYLKVLTYLLLFAYTRKTKDGYRSINFLDPKYKYEIQVRRKIYNPFDRLKIDVHQI